MSETLAQIRENVNWTTDDVATITGVPLVTIEAAEAGEIGLQNWQYERLAALYSVTEDRIRDAVEVGKRELEEEKEEGGDTVTILRQLRELAGWSVEEVMRVSGFSASTISRYENSDSNLAEWVCSRLDSLYGILSSHPNPSKCEECERLKRERDELAKRLAKAIDALRPFTASPPPPNAYLFARLQIEEFNQCNKRNSN
jgi:transcriptional regulator with XRE-family HTH domain